MKKYRFQSVSAKFSTIILGLTIVVSSCFGGLSSFAVSEDDYELLYNYNSVDTSAKLSFGSPERIFTKEDGTTSSFDISSVFL